MNHLSHALHRHALAFGFALSLTMCATAAARAPGDDLKNAATWYGRSIEAWQQFKYSNPQQYQLITEYAGDPAQPITPDIRAALASVQGVISDFKRGSQQEYCDYSLDYSQGFSLLLPHLGAMRDLARAVRADATVRLADGDTNGAAADLASMYKSSGHFGDDRVLISSLVGQAIFGFADAGVQNALDNALFNAADAAALLSGVEQLGVNDPFQYVESQAMEQELALATFEKYRGVEGMQQLLSLLGEDTDDGIAQELGGLDDAGFDAALAQYDEVMTQMNAAYSITDKDAAIAEAQRIEEAISNGEFGPLAKALAPAHSKLLERKFVGEQMVRDRLETLGALASGEKKPEEVANAARWYLMAIDMWEALPLETRTRLLTANFADRTTPLSPEVVAALVEVQPILDVMREASIKRRCDFTVFVQHRGVPAVAPHYAPGMHELLRVLSIDATRLQAADDAAGAMDRYAIVLRAAGHLGGDANLAVCRTGHVHFNATLEQLEAANEAGMLDLQSPAATALADAAGRVSRKDPFGYLAALQKTREGIIANSQAQPQRLTQEDFARWGEQMQVIRGYNADQTMFVLVILNERMRRMIANPPLLADGAVFEADDITLPETIERMQGVFDAHAVEAVRAEFDEIGPRIAADDWQIFLGRPATPIAGLNQGITRARGDLRRATSLLLLPDEAPTDEGETKQPN